METKNYKPSDKGLDQDLHSAVIFLCTPRCGTQWISNYLSEYYSDEAVTLHEPLENEYYLKKNLGKLKASATKREAIAKHLDFVDEITNNMIYIEVGWQSIAGIAELYQRLPNRLKVIHLYRNPVKVAASLVTHNWYTGKVKERFEKAELTPFDEGAFLTEYKEKWETLSLFEKSLYYWTEINLRAVEIKYRYPHLPFFSLKFEDFFEGKKEIQRITLIEMLAFMGLSYDDNMLKALDVKYDKYRSRTSININWKKIYDHPQTVALGEKLGYGFDDEINLSRYKDPFGRIILRKLKSLLRKFGRTEIVKKGS